MARIWYLLLILLFTLPCKATVVTTVLYDPNITPVVEDAFVRFELKNYGRDVPRVPGGNVVLPSFIDGYPDVNGVVTLFIQGNDTITPNGTYYSICYYRSDVRYYCCFDYITGATDDLGGCAGEPVVDDTIPGDDVPDEPVVPPIEPPPPTFPEECKSTRVTTLTGYGDASTSYPVWYRYYDWWWPQALFGQNNIEGNHSKYVIIPENGNYVFGANLNVQVALLGGSATANLRVNDVTVDTDSIAGFWDTFANKCYAYATAGDFPDNPRESCPLECSQCVGIRYDISWFNGGNTIQLFKVSALLAGDKISVEILPNNSRTVIRNYHSPIVYFGKLPATFDIGDFDGSKLNFNYKFINIPGSEFPSTEDIGTRLVALTAPSNGVFLVWTENLTIGSLAPASIWTGIHVEGRLPVVARTQFGGGPFRTLLDLKGGELVTVQVQCENYEQADMSACLATGSGAIFQMFKVNDSCR